MPFIYFSHRFASQQAQASIDKKEYTTIKPTITAAQNMVDKSWEALSEAQSSI
jgi:hypothetical protein